VWLIYRGGRRRVNSYLGRHLLLRVIDRDRLPSPFFHFRLATLNQGVRFLCVGDQRLVKVSQQAAGEARLDRPAPLSKSTVI
jgi:hypothetical protein